ncbi:HAD hydrolase-like protein [Porticoccaceae bacterium]|nr:HAD hydrolase-like protein [Porticoccaceae bacterium]
MQSSRLGRIHLFDCDGVLLDSNKLKIQALADALFAVGASKEFTGLATENFRRNFGISRLDHFKTFESIESESFTLTARLSAQAISIYSEKVVSLYRECANITATEDYISGLPSDEDIFVVSASDQNELRSILPSRFSKVWAINIFGGPTSKIDNIGNILADRSRENAVLYGDSIHDAQAAKFHGIEFYGVSQYAADADALCVFCGDHNMPVVENCMQIKR